MSSSASITRNAAPETVQRPTLGGLLLPVEAMVLKLICLMAIGLVVLAPMRGITVDYLSFFPKVLVGAALFAVAAGYRLKNRSPNIPLSLIAISLFVMFSAVGAALNYVLAPVGTPPIDPFLVRLDSMAGFDWIGFVDWFARYPAISGPLLIIYNSSLIQLAAVIIVLGLTGRQVQLHRFLLSGIAASIVSIAFWSVFPSIGPAATLAIDPQTVETLGLLVGPEYSTALRGLLETGVDHVSADNLLGLIAFPSMHTVMMCMTVWYMRQTRLFPVIVLINLPMIPAILLHGGHHLVDVASGIILFGIVAAIVRRAVPETT